MLAVAWFFLSGDGTTTTPPQSSQQASQNDVPQQDKSQLDPVQKPQVNQYGGGNEAATPDNSWRQSDGQQQTAAVTAHQPDSSQVVTPGDEIGLWLDQLPQDSQQAIDILRQQLTDDSLSADDRSRIKRTLGKREVRLIKSLTRTGKLNQAYSSWQQASPQAQRNSGQLLQRSMNQQWQQWLSTVNDSSQLSDLTSIADSLADMPWPPDMLITASEALTAHHKAVAKWAKRVSNSETHS